MPRKPPHSRQPQPRLRRTNGDQTQQSNFVTNQLSCVTDSDHSGDAMLRISRDLSIDENDIDIAFVRASGPGGQNVNKLSTAAQLRFDTRRIALAPDVAARLSRLAGQRMTKDGVIVIHAQRFRTQDRNRTDAIDRLLELLREAAIRPTPRRPTRPTLGSKQRRLEGKKRRSDVKAKRGAARYDD
jgi:ribosome-associated protein